MDTRPLVSFVLLLVLVTSAFPQQQPAAPTADDVVKITTNLVQFDVVVTGKDGKQVTDLKASDFIVLQDGKPQKVTNFSYVTTRGVQPPAAASAPVGSTSSVIAPPPVRTQFGGTGRVITFVVDDGNCGATQVGIRSAREGIEKFVNEQMAPTDLVAIYQTRSGSSMFQQYTSDRTQLLRVARKIRWYPPQIGCGESDGSFYKAAKPNTFDKLGVDSNGTLTEVTKTIESDAERRIRENNEDRSSANQVVGTLGVLRYIIKGLEPVSGRKVVFLMSDGMPLRNRDTTRTSTGAISALRDLTEAANRSSVVFNTIDARGLFDPSFIEARDRVQTRDNATASEPFVAERTAGVTNTRDGLQFLAAETGGQFFANQNYLDVPVRQALNLEKGYYLLAYEPYEGTFKSKNYNNIEIKLTRPDLKVLSRAGFFGTPTERARPKKRTADSDLYEALVAPLPSAGLSMRLTAFFENSAAGGNIVRALTHLDGDQITFAEDGNGMVKAVFDVVAVTMNEKNEIVDEFNRAHTFKIQSAALPLIKQNGLIYTTDVPIKKPGTYNFRVAVRDAASKMLGSASQVVAIPDLKKGDLSVSALTVSHVSPDGKFSIPSAVKPEQALSLSPTPGVPAIRKFRAGMILAYSYRVYNAKLNPATGKPSLSVQMNLYRDGQLIEEGQPQPADLQPQTDWSRISDFTYFRLTPRALKGDYTLQLIVRDLLPGSGRVSSQSVDFEVEG